MRVPDHLTPIFVGGRFLWHVHVFHFDRYYCPDCRARVHVPPGGDLVLASAAHVCPALVPGQVTIAE